MNTHEFFPSSETFHIPDEFQQNLGHAVTELLQEEANSPENSAENVRVSPENYPLLSKHQVRNFDSASHYKSSDPMEMQNENLNETLGRYVRDTADLIATITGSGETKDTQQPYDHVVYLDKSGRPAAWLVNAFWDDFAPDGTERPDQSFVAIDRQRWFEISGTDILPGEHVKNQDGSTVLATFSDFNKAGIDPEYFAKLRALYLENGLTGEETPSDIMQTPSTLDKKRILIVDEVKRSGSTLDIAQWLFQQAFPDAEIDQAYFWTRSEQEVKDGKGNTADIIVGSIPIWYNHTSEGRGVGDINPPFYEKRLENFQEKYPDQDPSKVRAQSYGSEFLGTIVDLDQETQHSSRALASEIVQMEKDYRAGHILMSSPRVYNQDKFIEHYEDLGVVFAPEDNPAKNTYINIKKSYQTQ